MEQVVQQLSERFPNFSIFVFLTRCSSISCGLGGSRSRGRLCTAPAHGGRNCSGQSEQVEECSQLSCPGEQELLCLSEWRSPFSLCLKRAVYFASQNGRSGAVAVSVVDTGAEAGEENAKERTSRALLVEMKNSWKHVSKKSVRVSCQFICLSVSEKLNSNYTTTTTNQIKQQREVP